MVVLIATTSMLVVTQAGGANELKTNSQVVFVGDSITTGYGTTNPKLDAYPIRWKNRVCGESEACRSRIRIVEDTSGCLTSKCGGPAPALVDQFEDRVLHLIPRPTTVIVEAGTNDLFAELSDQEYGDAYRALAQASSKAGVRLIVATLPPSTTRWPWHAAHNRQRTAVNRWIRTWFGMQNVLDLDVCLRLGMSDLADSALYHNGGGGDGIHPNTWGAMRMADCLLPSRIK